MVNQALIGALDNAIQCGQQIASFLELIAPRQFDAETVFDMSVEVEQIIAQLELWRHASYHPREAGPPPGAVVD